MAEIKINSFQAAEHAWGKWDEMFRIQPIPKPAAATLVAAAFFFLSSAVAAPLSFESAWQAVREKSDAIAARRADLARQKSLHRASMDLNLPSVSLSGSYTRLDEDITVSGEQLIESTGAGGRAALAQLQTIMGTLGHAMPALAPTLQSIQSLTAALPGITSTVEEKDIFTSSVRAIWPVFTGWKITAAQEGADAKAQESQSRLEMAAQGKFEDLTQYYFGTVLAREVLETRTAVEKGLAAHLDAALKMEAQGQIAKVERLQAEASLSKARVDRKKAERDLEIAKLALARLVKAEEDSFTLETPLFAAATLPSLTRFMDKTLATYPGLGILDAKENQARSLIKAEKSAYYPNVFLYGNYSLYERDTLAGEMMPEWVAGAGVNIALLDNHGRKYRVSAAGHALEQVKRLRSQAESDLSVLVEKTYRQAEQALEEYYGLNKSLELANENLRLRRTAFRQGLSTSLDVIDAQLYLAGITTRQFAAQFNFVLSLNRLLALSSGTDRFSEFIKSSPITEEQTSPEA